MTLNEATIVLALDGHSLAIERADTLRFNLAIQITTKLLHDGMLAMEDRMGAPFPASIEATRQACEVWREQLSAKRPALTVGR